METKPIGGPDEKTAAALVKDVQAISFEITDADTYVAARAVIERCDFVIEKLTKGKDGFLGFDDAISDAHKLHKSLLAMRDQFVKPIERVKSAWLNRMTNYRLAAEAKARQEREREAARLRQQEQKALEKDAKKLEKQGEVEAAEVLREQAAKLPTPELPAPPAVDRQEGEVRTEQWQFEVTDFEQVPAPYKLLDPTKKGERELIESKIRAVVSKLGDKMAIPGVRIWKTPGLYFRTGGEQ